MIENMPVQQGACSTEIRQNLCREMWQTLPRELKGNYRHQGLPALTCCLVGTQKILSAKPLDAQTREAVDDDIQGKLTLLSKRLLTH